jgi:DNA-binding transcriptional regulator WhiA
MSDISRLKYPKRSHRKKVIIPKQSKLLAEFLGIMMGDGGINNLWQATITLNAVADAKYAQYIFSLCKKLFGIVPAVRKRKGNKALVISLASTSVVDFLVSQGLSRGNKIKNGLNIPDWIFKNKSYQKLCLRGLVDTDGCIYIHKHRVCGKLYQNIGLSFSSHSPELILFIIDTLEKFGIMAYITGRGTEVCIYQKDHIAKYLKIFGTSNDRIRSVYKKWRDARVV